MGAAEKARLWLFEKYTAAGKRGLLNFLPDRTYLAIQYFLKLGRRLRLDPPTLYNEKLQWIKLYDRREEYHTYVDKLAVRDFVRERAGEKYLVPLLASCDDPSQIDWDALPDRFVVKCTHGSSCNILCPDKSRLEIPDAMRKLRNWMGRTWYPMSREWPYLGVKPRIIVEKFLGTDDGKVPYDYKILCFDGEPAYVIVDVDRYSGHKRNFYDLKWRRQDMFNRHPGYDGDVPRPACLDEMLDVARKLSKGIPHIRIDLYAVGEKVYFGEMTFFHGFGMEVFRPRSFEEKLGSLIRLPNEKGKP